MLEQCDLHGGNAEQCSAAFAFDELEHERRIERNDRHVRGARVERAEHSEDASGSVEQRHRVHVHIAGDELDLFRKQRGVVGQ